jgi:DNA polymerase-4
MSAFLPPDTAPRWLFVDMNSYFASCEQQDRPALRGKPVAVVPMQTDSTCAIAASYEAKAYGVKTGTIIGVARQKCPDLVCVLARHHVYVDYHHKILAEVVKHTPIHKVWSVDELSSCLTPDYRTEEKAIGVAHRIKGGLRTNVGEYIRCSIGIAPNSFLAKVATDMQKPDGLVYLGPHNLEERLFALDLTDLPGINTRMEERLWRKGIRSIEDLWCISPKQARAVWGSVEGERFWYNLHGYEVPDRITHRSMIGHSRILDPELRPVSAAWTMAQRLTLKAASRLRRLEYYATRFALSVRTVEGVRCALEVKLAPTQDNFTFARSLREMWAEMLARLAPDRLKKISVTFYGLCQRHGITPDLFDEHSEAYRTQMARYDTVSSVIDAINTRFGTETLRMGITPRTAAGYVGTKIAFNRVPDAAEFAE